MRRRISFSSAWSLVATGLVLLGTACSDSTTAPRSLRTADDASLSIGTGVPAGSATATIPLASSAATTFIGRNALATSAPAFGDPFVAGGSTAVIAPLNVAWHAAFPGSAWIGIAANAAASTVLPGTYRFQQQFTVPPGATNILLNLSAYNDNAIRIYLNGVDISNPGGQLVADCLPPKTNAQCNWQTALNVTATPTVGLNTLTFDVINTRVGYNGNGPADPTATANCLRPTDAAADWTPALCQNPSGLDYVGTVYYTPFVPRVVALFVIGDVEPHAVGDNVNFWGAQWWKNNDMSGHVDNGYESFKGYAVTSTNGCPGTWTSLPGNSSNPPDAIADDIAIIVTSQVNKNGNDISGDIKQIVMVHQDGGYGPNPGHSGNGVVTSIVCTAP